MENSAGKIGFLFLIIMLTNISISEPKSIDGITKMLKTLEIVENLETVKTFEIFDLDIVKTLKVFNSLVDDYCRKGYSRTANGCYFNYSYSKKKWDSARLHCQAKGGDLAIGMVDSMPMFSEVYGSYLTMDPWYGAYREGDEFLFVNGTVLPANSSLWDEGYPATWDGSSRNGNCTYLSGPTKKLRTYTCSYSGTFFCQS